MPDLVEVDQEVPVGTLSIGLVMTLGISSISSSHVVKDDATGLTYVDTVTTSVGRILLSGPDLNASSTGPTIETSPIRSKKPTETHHWVNGLPPITA